MSIAHIIGNLPIDRTKLKVLDQLLCGNCQLYLNISPIMTFKSGTTICGRCYDPIKYENVAVADKPTPNIPFESVIKLFPFPCIYRDQGCTARHTTKLYLKHEIICNFRPFKCPVKSCKWTGLMSGFKIHFEVTHTNKFSSSSVIPIDTTTTHVDYYFINVNDMELLFQYKFNDTSDKYYCDCVCLTYPKIKGAYTMELEFIKADKTSSIIFRKKMSIVLNPIDENTALEIDIKSLQTLSKTRYLNAKITVLPPELTENSYQMTDNKLLNELKCPVCLHLFVPPIFLCGNGHSICNPCKSQLVTCPICRDPYGNSVHNFTLEKLICELIYPCKYSISGCQHVAPSTQLQQHESTCDFSYL